MEDRIVRDKSDYDGYVVQPSIGMRVHDGDKEWDEMVTRCMAKRDAALKRCESRRQDRPPTILDRLRAITSGMLPGQSEELDLNPRARMSYHASLSRLRLDNELPGEFTSRYDREHRKFIITRTE